MRIILRAADIRAIFTNGATSTGLYEKYLLPLTGIPSVPIPSTSPANAAASFDALYEKWKVVADHLR